MRPTDQQLAKMRRKAIAFEDKFCEGYQAGRLAFHNRANPYHAKSRAADQWATGYNMAINGG